LKGEGKGTKEGNQNKNREKKKPKDKKENNWPALGKIVANFIQITAPPPGFAGKQGMKKRGIGEDWKYSKTRGASAKKRRHGRERRGTFPRCSGECFFTPTRGMGGRTISVTTVGWAGWNYSKKSVFGRITQTISARRKRRRGVLKGSKGGRVSRFLGPGKKEFDCGFLRAQGKTLPPDRVRGQGLLRLGDKGGDHARRCNKFFQNGKKNKKKATRVFCKGLVGYWGKEEIVRILKSAAGQLHFVFFKIQTLAIKNRTRLLNLLANIRAVASTTDSLSKFLLCRGGIVGCAGAKLPESLTKFHPKQNGKPTPVCTKPGANQQGLFLFFI